MKRLALAVVFVLAGAGAVSAQSWDSPSFMSPVQGDDVGVYFVDGDVADWGLQGIWRQTGNLNLGIRGGVLGGDDQTYGLIAAEFFGPIMSGNADLPLIVITWTAGAGAIFGDGTAISVPVGLSFGANLDAGRIAIIPYVHPRFAIDFLTGDGDSEVELNLPVDLGADVRLPNGAIIRVGGTLTGDFHEAIGVGLAFPFGRSVSVR